MILLDTNVISEFMRKAPDPSVVSWLNSQPESSIWTTAVTVFEVEFGLQSMAPGKRRSFFESAFQAILNEDLDGRILPFETEAALMAGAQAAKL